MSNSSKNTTSLPLMEQFYSIQGEGNYSGHAAVFIRLGGCDVGCVWCDVKESWEAAKHPNTSIQTIVDFVLDTNGNLGLGTDAPTQKLHVAGGVRISGAFYDSSNSAGSSTKVLLSNSYFIKSLYFIRFTPA